MHARTGALQSVRHDLIQRLAIATSEEDVLSMVAARSDMINGAKHMGPTA
jgi:hypothetical protein